jgi:hypothetical protein
MVISIPFIRNTDSIRCDKLKKIINSGALFVVMSLWGVNLGCPLNHLQHIRWTLAGHDIPVYYFFIVMPMLAAAAGVLAFKRNWTQWELLWWLLPLICLPGILHSADPLWSLRQWLSWIIRGVIPGGVIFLLWDRQWEAWLLYLIYPIVIAAALLGLSELYCNHNPLWDNSLIPIPKTSQQNDPFYRPFYSDYRDLVPRRPEGTQGNRIPYAAMMLPFLPLGLWLLKYQKRFYRPHLLGVGMLVSILLLAQVRAVWVGLLASVLLMLAAGVQKNLRETAKIFIGILLCLCGFLAWPKTHALLWDRFHSFHLAEMSIRERLAVLKTARVLKNHWFVGIGFGQFPTVCRPYYPSDLPWFGTPDNQYLRWVIENGVFSFGLLLAFLAGLAHAGWKRIQCLGDARQVDFYKSLLVGWGSLAVTFLFFDGFYWGACNMTFWCLLGMFAAVLKALGRLQDEGAPVVRTTVDLI